MNCPICGLGLQLKGIDKVGEDSKVHRFCVTCRVDWEASYHRNVFISISQKDMKMNTDYGFDYTCPHCHHKGSVFTVYVAANGWRCFNCGKIIPVENITPRGEFKVVPYKEVVTRSKSRSSRSRSSSPEIRVTPRASRPVPDGAVALATVAERLKVEPKKLRSWLRKVGWRAEAEARSQWVFSPGEVEDIIKKFGGQVR